jgi:hypothetical protein
MKLKLKIIALYGIILMTVFSCKKDDPKTIEFFVKLVNDNNEVINTFEKGDSILFKFYLKNNMGREVAYERPFSGIMDFLKVFKQNLEGEYEYIGHPCAYSPSVVIIEKINDNETKLLGSVPTSSEFNWPEMNPGNYYVGDTLKLTIDDGRLNFIQRIYFTIE